MQFNNEETISGAGFKEEDVHINRFHITYPRPEELLIKIKPTKNLALLFAFLFFGGMGAFFGYIMIIDYERDGLDYVSLFFCLFGSGMGILALIGAYSTKQSCYFKKDELIRTSLFGTKKIISRAHVKSVFISKTLFAERGKSADSYAYWVTLRVPHLDKTQYSLFNVEGRDSLTFMVGMMDQKGMNQAETESLQIAEIIAAHWNIPVSI